MQACLTVRPPDRAAIVRAIRPGEVLRIGRAADSGLKIEHPSVSRQHAELRHRFDAWYLQDLCSKNGSFVEGARLDGMRWYPLDRPGWLRFGEIHCELSLIDDSQAALAEAARRARRAAATAHTARIDGVRKLGELLDASLRGVLELAQCDRGFVLLERPDGDGFVVRASLAMDATRLASREFSGSVGAVRRALQQRSSVVVNDIPADAWLSARASVVASALGALVCLPLLDGDHALGAIYADRTQVGAPVTTLDQELLEAFAERAALWIAARRTSDLLAQHASGQSAQDLDWGAIVDAHGGAVA
jgi:hypothetical protein